MQKSMQKFLFITLGFMVASSVQAHAANPQMRTCRIAQGEFFAADVQQPTDSIGFCRFDQASIGALDLFYVLSGQNIPAAVQSFLSGNNACEGSAQIKSGIIDGVTQINYCEFSEDHSVIELNTLNRGMLAPENARLVEVLNSAKQN